MRLSVSIALVLVEEAELETTTNCKPGAYNDAQELGRRPTELLLYYPFAIEHFLPFCQLLAPEMEPESSRVVV